MVGRLENKVAIITGAAGGIGAATGLLFCEEGGRVALVDSDSDALPDAARVSAQRDDIPNSPTSDGQAKAVLEAVSRVGLAFHVSRVTPEVDLDKVFAAMPQLHGVALLVGGDAYLMSRGEQIVALAKRYRLPAIYDRREYAELGDS